MRNTRPSLLFIGFDLRLEIIGAICPLYNLLPPLSNHNPWRIAEKVVHLLKWLLRRLGQHEPEEDGVRRIADDEHEIEAPTNICDCNWGDLADHRIERERGHSRNTDTLGSSACVEDFGWDDPRQRSASATEGEVVYPSHDDEAPLSTKVGGYTRWELGEQSCRDNEGDHVANIAEDQWPATTELVNQHHAKELSDQGDDAVDPLVFECVLTRDADLLVDGNAVVLNCGDTGHLNRSLQSTAQEETSE